MTSVASDPDLRAEIRRLGRFDTNGCLQCGTCTLSCDLTASYAQFPRRTIRLGLLGLRSRLDASLDPWLCYYCGDCTTACPRESEPAEGMMTLRRYLATRYDWTGLAKRIYGSTAWEVGALLFVGLLVFGLALFYHLVIVGNATSDLTDTAFIEGLGLEHMFPMITVFTRIVVLVPVALLFTCAARMWWFTMHRDVGQRIRPGLYLREALAFIVQAAAQLRWRECKKREHRWFLHMLLVAGCFLLLVILLFVLAWFQTDAIYPLYHPQRWLGYLLTLMMGVPAVVFLVDRVRKQRQVARFSTPSDWIFPIMLLLTVATGIAVHILRYAGLAFAAHYAYAGHLIVATPLLVVEIPFGKWSHMIYRPLAFYFNQVRERAAKEVVAAQGVVGHAV